MKKLMLFFSMAILLTGCTTFDQHTGQKAIPLNTQTIVMSPLQADVQVLPQIKGTAVCESWLGGIFTKRPKTETFGAEIQVNDGNMAWDSCTRAAVYNALSKNHADYIVAPRYNTIKQRDLCLLGFLCLHKKYTVEITGYKGAITQFSPMDPKLMEIIYKPEPNTPQQPVKIGLLDKLFAHLK